MVLVQDLHTHLIGRIAHWIDCTIHRHVVPQRKIVAVHDICKVEHYSKVPHLPENPKCKPSEFNLLCIQFDSGAAVQQETSRRVVLTMAIEVRD